MGSYDQLSAEECARLFSQQVSSAFMDDRRGTLREMGIEPFLLIKLSETPAGRLELKRSLESRNNPELITLVSTQLFTEVENLKALLKPPKNRLNGWASFLRNSGAAVTGGAVVGLVATSAGFVPIVLVGGLGIAMFGYAKWCDFDAQSDIDNVEVQVNRLEETQRVLIAK